MRKKVNNYSYPVNVIADYLKFGQDNVLSDAELSLYEKRDDIKNLFEYYIENLLSERQAEALRLIYNENLSPKNDSCKMGSVS